jgi:glyoxylase-like metal-dependent hydrolase (beta-lactamase superfamily II)
MPSIAGYELFALETGRFGLDGGAMFGIVPKPLWQRRIPADERNRIPLAMRCLLAVGNDRVILVDNGLGDKYDAKFADIYAVDHSTYTLKKSLSEVGLGVSDVTDVILTHLHFDHCGGSTRFNRGNVEVAFPNATFHVQRRQWDWAADPNPRERNSFLEENLTPLAKSGQLALVDGAAELFPGVEVLPVDGHTRGMQLVKFFDQHKTLVFVADLLPTAAHIPEAWVMAYDLWPMTTMKEKKSFLSEAGAEGWYLFFEHDPSIEVARLEMSDRGWTPTDGMLLQDI